MLPNKLSKILLDPGKSLRAYVLSDASKFYKFVLIYDGLTFIGKNTKSMDKRRRDSFTDIRHILPKSIRSEAQIIELCNFLVAHREISEEMMMEIKCEKTALDMMTKLMQILSGGGNSAYDLLRIGLKEIKVPRHLIDMLPEFPSETSTSYTETYGSRTENTRAKERASSRQRLARSVQRQATLLGKVPRSSLQLYELPMKIKYADENKRIRQLTSEGPRNSLDTKTVIMVGISGSGKSLMINKLVNFLYGVDFENEFRFKLILEEKEKSEREEEVTTAMTSRVTAYELIHEQGFPMDFNLTLIDTPDFADDKGVSYDEIIVERIENMLQSREILPKQKLDAIGFIIPASTTRLTAEQKYVFDQILNILGKNLKENVTVLCTFADSQDPPAIETIKKDGIPVASYFSYFKFNNSAVFAPNDDVNKEENEYAWKIGHKCVNIFLRVLGNLESGNLNITNALLDERENLGGLLMSLKSQIGIGTEKLEQMEGLIDEISQLKEIMEQNKDYTVQKLVQRQYTETLKEPVTNCPICMYICHKPCREITGDDKNGCWAMSNGKCRICPGRCPWDVHKTGDRIYRYENVTVTETIQTMLEKYVMSAKSSDAKKQLLEKLLREYCDLKIKLLDDIVAAAHAANRLDQLALRNSYLTNVTYIERLIEQERVSKRTNKRKRIEQLQVMLGMAKILESARNNPDAVTQHMSAYELQIIARIEALNEKWLIAGQSRVTAHFQLH